jgi:putative ABC transport system permease protein
MQLRLLLRSALARNRRAHSLTALLAVLVAAAAATTLLTLYAGVDTQMHRELRVYGANIIIKAAEGKALPGDAQQRIEKILADHGRGRAAPYAYAIARSGGGSPLVIAGADMEIARIMNSWWAASGWPGKGQALLGVRAAQVLSPHGDGFDLEYQGRTVHLTPAGTLRTGSAEDSRVYLPLADFTAWTGLGPSVLEVSAAGSPSDTESLLKQLAQALPEAEVRPITRIAEGEARVLEKTRSTLLAAVIGIVTTSLLCMLATLTASVLDRRRDFALMKALGSGPRAANQLFATESAVLGLVGALLGYGAGTALAAWIGKVNFNAVIAPQLPFLPPVLAGGIALSLLATVVPMALLRGIEPAAILKGE